MIHELNTIEDNTQY